MTLLILNLVLLTMNLMGSGFLISRILYQYGYYMSITAKLLGGYTAAIKITLHCFMGWIQKATQQRLKVPSWSIDDNLHELTFIYKGKPCKVLLYVNTEVPVHVKCSDGDDVTKDVLPYRRVTPIKFTSEIYGDTLHESF